jgi:hypothetical protein
VVARIRTQNINGGFNVGMELRVWLSRRNGQPASGVMFRANV